MKYNTKNIFQILGLLLFVIVNASAQEATVLDKVIATVGNEYILFSDVEGEFAYAKEQNPSIDQQAKCQILDGLIAQNLIIHQAKLDSIEVTSDEVEGSLDLRFSNILRNMNNDEEFFEQHYGHTVSELKDIYREDQRQLLLAQRMQGQLISTVDITPEEVKEYFAQIPTDSLPYLNAEVEIAEIIMKPEINKVERQKALDKINMIYEKIISGESTLEDMAKEYSMDGSRGQGGDLGFAKRGSYVPEFEAVAFTLTEGEMSEVVETEFGFHIIKFEERRGLSVRVKHVLIRPEITDADLELTRTKIDSIRTLIIVDSMDFLTAVRRYSMEQLPSYSDGGRVTNPRTGSTFFETGQLDPDDYLAITDLEVGGITEPMDIELRGEKMFKILQLQYKTQPHRASLETDYDKIAYFSKESKKGEYFSNWVTEKMTETFIKVDKGYSFCSALENWIEKE